MVKYRTIVADPPWDHSDGFVSELAAGRRDRPLPYGTMSVEEIMELPVRSLADGSCRLFLWATNRFMPDAYEVLAAWGFRYVQTLVWEKPDPNYCTGSLTANLEFCLVGRRGSPPRLGRFPGAVLRAGSGQHSAKPEAFLDHVEQVSGGPYLEMFSRRARFGWDTWGDQALHGLEATA